MILTIDIIVYAIWQKKIKISYQVNPLDINDLEVININDFISLESLENEIVQISNIIPQAKHTYKFNCWTFEENENIKTVYPGQTIISNLDKISLKAEWKEEKYTDFQMRAKITVQNMTESLRIGKRFPDVWKWSLKPF